jgi:hypothetical protein
MLSAIPAPPLSTSNVFATGAYREHKYTFSQIPGVGILKVRIATSNKVIARVARHIDDLIMFLEDSSNLSSSRGGHPDNHTRDVVVLERGAHE